MTVFSASSHSSTSKETPLLLPRRKRGLGKISNINKFNVFCVALLVAVFGYLCYTNPVGLAVLLCSSIIFLSAWHISRSIPLVERFVKTRIRFYHVIVAVLVSTAIFGAFEMPAHAVFLSGLEQFFVTIANQANQGAAGGAENATPEVIKLVFNVIRGLFLLLVGAAALFAYNQAQQGNDWRPIATQVGMAFGIVIVIDVITYLFIGNGQGAGPAAP